MRFPAISAPLFPNLPSAISLLTISCLFLLSGCAALWDMSTTENEDRLHRGKLSDAMEKASDNYNGARVVEPSQESTNSIREQENHFHKNLDEKSYAVDLDSRVANDNFSDADEETSYFNAVSFVSGRSLIQDFHFSSHEIYQLTADTMLHTSHSLPSKNVSIGVYLMSDNAIVKSGDSSFESIDESVLTLSMGIRGRYFMRKGYISPYYIGSFGVGISQWSYRNSIKSGFETIDTDSLKSTNIYLGLGAIMTPFKWLGFCAEAGSQFTGWSNYTENDFENDVFRANTTLLLKLEAEIIF